MCGIAGIWQIDGTKVSKDNLKRFTDSLSHRGPDAGCYWINDSGDIGLGHRRLSILDLSANANQPMSFANDRYWIIFNGEIFNFLELRKELESKGFVFRTNSDTEVILAAYDLWGKDCLSKFNGMWGLVIYDKQQEKLFLARDRFGIKPLYYLYKSGKIFAFASETISFKYLDGLTREFNEDIYQLLPGHFMEISKKESSPRQVRWWTTLNAIAKVPNKYEDQVEMFRELFFDAVKIRLRSDVPIASALSGGLDSSAVYCAIYHIMNSDSVKERTPDNWQKAFFARFPGTSIDEYEYASEVVKFTNGKAEYLETNYTNLVENIRSSTILFDSIYNTPISVSSDIYRAMNSQGIKVSMDGHGVDEMLFGYPNMIENVIRGNDQTEFQNPLLKTVARMKSRNGDDHKTIETTSKLSLRRGLFTSVKKFGRKILPVKFQRLLAREGFIGDELSLYHKSKLSGMTGIPYDTDQMQIESKVPFEAFHLNTLPTILRNFDRTSMQNSIEIRMPFMDYRLVSFIFSLPFESKVGGGYSKRCNERADS